MESVQKLVQAYIDWTVDQADEPARKRYQWAVHYLRELSPAYTAWWMGLEDPVVVDGTSYPHVGDGVIFKHDEPAGGIFTIVDSSGRGVSA